MHRIRLLRRAMPLFWAIVITAVAGLAVVVGTVVQVGCASVKVKRVPAHDANVEGLRFYRPRPYLLVSDEPEQGTTAKGATAKPAMGGIAGATSTLHFSIVWLPDLSQEYVIQASAGMGTVTFNPTLENGWKLTALNANVDSKTAELLTAAGTMVTKAGVGKSEASTTRSQRIVPGLFRFVFESNSGSPNYGQIVGVDWENPVLAVQKD